MLRIAYCTIKINRIFYSTMNEWLTFKNRHTLQRVTPKCLFNALVFLSLHFQRNIIRFYVEIANNSRRMFKKYLQNQKFLQVTRASRWQFIWRSNKLTNDRHAQKQNNFACCCGCQAFWLVDLFGFVGHFL